MNETHHPGAPSRYTDETFAAALIPWEDPTRFRRPAARSIAVFRSRFYERYLARAHWVTPILWFGPVIVYGIWNSIARENHGLIGTALLFLSGWFVWSLVEYLLHRFLFHMPAKNDEERLRAFLVHGYHHVYPDDPLRLVAPPMMSWPLAIVVFALTRMILGAHFWAPVFAGIATGYVAYDWIHYYVHHARPKTRLGRALREYHMRHHFEDTRSHYGVSSPLWDFVFGTAG